MEYQRDNTRHSLWWISIIAWDGILPLLVATIPITARLLLPKDNLAGPIAIGVVPLAAALIRCMIGERQIRRVCNGELPLLRQAGMAAAIVCLMLFEISVSVFVFTDNEPMAAWCIPFAFYVLYLATISRTLAPRNRTAAIDPSPPMPWDDFP